jgi:hypothetical protein
MEIQEIRRARLAQLIRERYDSSQSKFVEETGENQGEVSALLRTKSFGERKARKIEAKCGLPSGWMDLPATPEDGRESAASPTSRPSLMVVETVEQKWMALVYVNQRELDILTNFREATEIGRSLIETAAVSATKDDSGSGTAHQS